MIVEAYLSAIIIRFLWMIFFHSIFDLIARNTYFEVFVRFRINVVWSLIEIRGVANWWHPWILTYFNNMFSSSTHLDRILVWHHNLLNATSLINFNSYIISRRLRTLIKHAAATLWFFNGISGVYATIVDWLLHYSSNPHYTRRLYWLFITYPFDIWLRIST